MDYLKKNLGKKNEYETLLYHIHLLQNEETMEAMAYRAKYFLSEKGVHFSEHQEGEEVEYLAFPLQGESKEKLEAISVFY